LKLLAREIGVLLALAAVPALLAAWLHPAAPHWGWTRPAVARISLVEASKSGSPVVWVDARSDPAFREDRIPGAVPLNEDRWESLIGGFIAVWRPGLRVVVYCDSQECDASQHVALRLRRELSIDEVYVLSGGWSEWQKAQSK